jgi:hypothetical protein
MLPIQWMTLVAFAAGVQIPVQGALTDGAGAPFTGAHTVDLAVWGDAAATDLVHDEALTATFAAGAFSVALGSTETLLPSALSGREALWVTVAVDGGAPSAPVRLGHAPLAAWAVAAGDASTLESHPAADFRLSSTPVPWGDVDASGAPASVNPGFDVGDGLTVNAGEIVLDQGLVAGVCVDAVQGDIDALTDLLAGVEGDVSTLTTGLSDLETYVLDLDDAKVARTTGVQVNATTGALYTDAGTGPVSLPDARNWLINGGFDIFQRGPARTSVNHNDFSADRWVFTASGGSSSGSFASLRAASEPPNGLTQYALAVSAWTPNANDWRYTTQWLEPVDARSLRGKTVTFSVWVRTDGGSGSSVLGLWYGTGASRQTGDLMSVVANRTHAVIAPTNTWARYSVTATIPTNTTLIGAFFGGKNGVNAANSNTAWYLSQAMLNEGPSPAPFRRAGHTMANELDLAQRFYQKSYDLDTAPGAATTAGATGYVSANAGNGEQFQAPFQTRMRVSPSITMYSPVTGSAGCVRNYTSGADVCSVNAQAGGERGFSGRGQNPGDGNLFMLHFTADAEL